MEKQKELLEHLKQNHTGKDKAVCSRELERLFSLNGRTIRRIISSLRQDGNPICSSGRGYYFARTQDEINDTVSRLNELVTGVSNARTRASVCEDRTGYCGGNRHPLRRQHGLMQGGTRNEKGNRFYRRGYPDPRGMGGTDQ